MRDPCIFFIRRDRRKILVLLVVPWNNPRVSSVNSVFPLVGCVNSYTHLVELEIVYPDKQQDLHPPIQVASNSCKAVSYPNPQGSLIPSLLSIYKERR